MMKLMSFSGKVAAKLGRVIKRLGAAMPAAKRKSRRVKPCILSLALVGAENSGASPLIPSRTRRRWAAVERGTRAKPPAELRSSPRKQADRRAPDNGRARSLG